MNEYYIEISNDEFEKLLMDDGNDHLHQYLRAMKIQVFIRNNWIPFTNDEIDKIKFLNYISMTEITDYPCIRNCAFNIKLSNKNIQIFKLVNEWYFVKVITTQKDVIYKCDQLEGLLKCLNELSEPIKESYYEKDLGEMPRFVSMSDSHLLIYKHKYSYVLYK